MIQLHRPGRIRSTPRRSARRCARRSARAAAARSRSACRRPRRSRRSPAAAPATRRALRRPDAGALCGVSAPRRSPRRIALAAPGRHAVAEHLAGYLQHPMREVVRAAALDLAHRRQQIRGCDLGDRPSPISGNRLVSSRRSTSVEWDATQMCDCLPYHSRATASKLLARGIASSPLRALLLGAGSMPPPAAYGPRRALPRLLQRHAGNVPRESAFLLPLKRYLNRHHLPPGGRADFEVQPAGVIQPTGFVPGFAFSTARRKVAWG